MGNALHLPSKNGNIDALRKIISDNPNINLNSRNKSGNTPLHKCCQYGHEVIASELVSRGVDINVENRDKYTPLHFACMKGHTKTARELIALGANMNLRGGVWNSTPLHWACIHNHVDVIKELVSRGADVNVKDDLGKIAFQYIKDENLRKEMVIYFFKFQK